MSETKHTPGPWRADYGPQHVTIECSNPTISTTIAELAGRPSPEIFANARLIAAAPDMLEALTALLARFDDNPELGELIGHVEIERARAAIRKAEDRP